MTPTDPGAARRFLTLVQLLRRARAIGDHAGAVWLAQRIARSCAVLPPITREEITR